MSRCKASEPCLSGQIIIFRRPEEIPEDLDKSLDTLTVDVSTLGLELTKHALVTRGLPLTTHSRQCTYLASHAAHMLDNYGFCTLWRLNAAGTCKCTSVSNSLPCAKA